MQLKKLSKTLLRRKRPSKKRMRLRLQLIRRRQKRKKQKKIRRRLLNRKKWRLRLVRTSDIEQMRVVLKLR